MSAEQRRGALDRVLSIFTEVHPGESTKALLLCVNVFILLTTYYIIKPLREAFILSSGPGAAEVKSYAAAGQALLLLGVVPLYGMFASRVGRRKLIDGVTLFFAACLVAFYLLAKAQAPVGVPFFLWVGIFNLMVIAQFWSFANDLYSTEDGKRLFPIVGFGASAGAVFGSFLTGQLLKGHEVAELLLLSAAMLAGSLVVTHLAEAQHRRQAARGAVAGAGAATSARATTAPRPDDAPLEPGNAFALVFRSRYLLGIALLILVLNWVNTNGEYILGKTVANAAAQQGGAVDVKQFIGKFYADFFLVVNIVSLGLQLFVVSRVFKWFGVRASLFVLPTIALFGYSFLAFYPLLSVVRWAKIAENATDYSLQNTVRNALFLPTTRTEKYKAKQVIDTLCVRLGDVLSAVLVAVGTTFLAFKPQHFALVNLVFVVLWLGFAAMVAREHRRLA